jgi:hypothetical protein
MKVHTKVAGDKNDHDDDADNGEDVHIAAPRDRTPVDSRR